MSIDIKKYLNIPQECFVGKKIFKKLFYENYKFKSSEKKFFTDDIDEIHWLYSVKSETANIPSFISEERDYEEIAYIEVSLINDSKTKKIMEIVHSSIPYPVVLILKYQEKVLLSLTHKKINKADKTKSVIGMTFDTGWIEDQDEENNKNFLLSLDFRKLPFEDLYKHFSSIFELVVDLECRKKLGGSSKKISTEEKIIVMDSIALHEAKIAKLEKELVTEEHIGRKVEINVEIHNNKSILEEYKKKI